MNYPVDALRWPGLKLSVVAHLRLQDRSPVAEVFLCAFLSACDVGWSCEAIMPKMHT